MKNLEKLIEILKSSDIATENNMKWLKENRETLLGDLETLADWGSGQEKILSAINGDKDKNIDSIDEVIDGIVDGE